MTSKDELWVSHGLENHPVSQHCENCETVKKEFKEAVKKAGGKKAFLKSLNKQYD